MKLCRFDDNRLGIVEGDLVKDVTSVLSRLGTFQYPLPGYDPLIARLDELRPVLEDKAAAAPARPLSSVSLLSPVANPGKVVAAPVNYRKHFDEVVGDPELHHGNQINEIRRVGLFLKATSSVIGASQPVLLRHPDRRCDHEIELVAIIGKPANNVPRERVFDYIAGYCIGLDMTVRGPEERSFRKSVDTFSVLGPFLVTPDEISNPSALDLALDVNGERRQRANTRNLVLSIADLIVWASSFYTLHPGDVLFTGTPEGVGPVLPGDVISASISEIGHMNVQVGSA